MIAGDGAGLVNVPALKGIHYAMRSGMLAAETALEALAPGRTAWEPGALESYDEALRESYVWKDLERVRNMRPAFQYGFTRGAMLAGMALNTLGKLPPRDLKLEADAQVPVFVGDRPAPAADGKLTFDKLSSVFLSGNKTRDDAPSHVRVDRKVRREVAETWVHMCPAQVYELGGVASPAGNVVDVEVTASNCVQCGAITAKGGRLTPPEGGDGPEYRLM
jgi:electron-transferring-flavoprotein dehydrogenase